MISHRQADLLESYKDEFHGIMELERHHMDTDFVWQVVPPTWFATKRVKEDLKAIFEESGFIEYNGTWQYEMQSDEEEDSEIYEMLIETMKRHDMTITFQRIHIDRIRIDYDTLQ